MPGASSSSTRERLANYLAGAGVLLALVLVGGLRSAPALRQARGFLGTPAGLLADVNLLLELALVAGVIVGGVLARRGDYTAHAANQTAWVLVSVVLVFFIMLGSLLALWPGPGQALDWAAPTVRVAGAHSLVGGLSILCSLYLLWRMSRFWPARWELGGWKGLMRLALAGYGFTGIGGLAVYYFWYLV